MAAPVGFDGRAGRFRWPRRSFSMAAPVGFDGRAGRQLCPYEAQYNYVLLLEWKLKCTLQSSTFTSSCSMVIHVSIGIVSLTKWYWKKKFSSKGICSHDLQIFAARMKSMKTCLAITTRQSEMANTSPATCQCLATFTPLKSKMLIFFSWRHFSARSSCYIINWYGYPRGSHEKYLKEIVSPVFEIRYWIVTC